jgi:hypothetical protein
MKDRWCAKCGHKESYVKAARAHSHDNPGHDTWLEEDPNATKSGKTFDEVLFAAFCAGVDVGNDSEDEFSGGYLRNEFNKWRARLIDSATAGHVSTDREGEQRRIPGAEQYCVPAFCEDPDHHHPEVPSALRVHVVGPPQPAFGNPSDLDLEEKSIQEIDDEMEVLDDEDEGEDEPELTRICGKPSCKKYAEVVKKSHKHKKRRGK